MIGFFMATHAINRFLTNATFECLSFAGVRSGPYVRVKDVLA